MTDMARRIRFARRHSTGFTLIELMIVVAIVGVLAVLAIYGVRKYIANSKTAEARNSLGQIGKDAATAYEKETMSGGILAQGTSTPVLRALCAKAGAVPSSTTAIQGKKYQSTPAEWNTAGWACLKFALDQPQYFQYNYDVTATTGAGATFTASAHGDLNGDTVTSNFQLQGSIGSGNVLNVAPNVTESNPEE